MQMIIPIHTELVTNRISATATVSVPKLHHRVMPR